MRRQRGALRVVQATLLGIAIALAFMARGAWEQHEHPLAPAAALGAIDGAGLGEFAVLSLGALGFAGLALAMGLKVVRGPDPQMME